MKQASFNIPGVSVDNVGAPPGAFVLSIEGLDATGKSRLALEASIAGPMVYLSSDGGVQRADPESYRRMGREIHIGLYVYSAPKYVPKKQGGPEGDFWVAKGKELMRDKYEPFLQAFDAAAEEPAVRTIVIDTATEFWDLAQLANFGRLSQNSQLMYGPVHVEYK